MNYSIRRELDVHRCSECKCSLEDGNFVGCGILFETPEAPGWQAHFDYHCPTCGHYGRWMLAIPDDLSALDAMKSLVNAFDTAQSQRGDIALKLTKINSVEDLLKLGGNDAPKERAKYKRDGDGDLP